MQLVHTRTRWLAPFTLAFTACRFTFQRRRVVLWACEMLFPNCGPLPQRSHFCAMTVLLQSRIAELPHSRNFKRGIESSQPRCGGNKLLNWQLQAYSNR